jgi:hypothetical protein
MWDLMFRYGVYPNSTWKNTILDFTLVSALNQLDNVEIKKLQAKKEMKSD